jgi:hypothetical protein
MAKSTHLRLTGLILFLCALGVHAQTVTTFEGIDASQVAKPQLDVDPNGAIGTKQFMEWTNNYYQAYDKVTFAPVWSAPQAGATPWVTNGVTNCTSISGDGIIIFDRLASRWVIAAHNAGSSTYYYCVAISNTDDLKSPTLAWHTYGFPLNSILGSNSQGTTYFPDWPKLATWPDAYYLGIDLNDVNNGFREVGVVACALDRTNMLTGGTPNPPQCFRDPSTVTGSLYLRHSLQPADVEGTTPPPAGAPEFFASIQNPPADGVTTTSSTFNLWQFHVDWTNPANSTFSQSTVSAPSFTPGCYSASVPANTVCVPEPTTSTSLQPIDSVGDRFMFRFAYRNFGSYQSYLISHTVQTGTGVGSQTGIRWYELRGSGIPSLFQSGTINPDNSTYRFMPSMAQDQAGNAAVGYSVSSASIHPGMSASWWNLQNQTTPAELSLFSGAGDQENTYHWGDYSSMTVDPVGDCAFWYVNEYFSANQIGTGKAIWQTRISTFSIPSCQSVTMAPSSLTFAAQAVGTSSPKQNVTLTNNQAVTLNISSIFGSGANPGDFSQSNNCGSSVAAGGSCTFSIGFTPTATGTRTATLNVADDAVNSPQTVSLSGTGTTGPTLSISPTGISFGNEAVGFTSAISKVTVTNTSTSTVTFTSVAVTGTNLTDFAQSNNCVPTLTAGSSCTINVTFTPMATGSLSAAVTLTDNAVNSPQSVSLSGTGVPPVALSATTLNLGTVVMGTGKSAPPVTLTNQQPVALTGIVVTVTGSAAFTQVNTCGTSVAAGGHCTITVTFTPTTAGAQTGTVNVTDSASNSPQTIALSGTGQLPVTVSPLSLSFGTVTVGTTSAPKPVTVTNNQKTTLTITSVGFTGVDAGDYAQTNNCGSSLAAGAKCTLNVTFKPKATGVRPATLAITDSATTSPQKVKLTGTGQ